jgi:hypothetical protein
MRLNGTIPLKNLVQRVQSERLSSGSWFFDKSLYPIAPRCKEVGFVDGNRHQLRDWYTLATRYISTLLVAQNELNFIGLSELKETECTVLLER